MNLMKRLSLLCCALILTSVGAFATTLGEATSSVIEDSGRLIAAMKKQPSTWGVETALTDLQLLNRSARALEKALDGRDAETLREQQTALTTADRRMKTSGALLPDSAQSELESLSKRVAAINTRLTQLRLRFGSKATTTPGALSSADLVPSEGGLEIYENPAQLLIDVRDARRLVQSLQVGRYPQFGVGFQSPNNLDPLQIRRLVLATWELERQLSSQYEDVQQSLKAWRKVQREYNRMGYPAPSAATRQLERVMRRLGAFYAEME